MTKHIYLDHHATTPLDPSVYEAMAPYHLHAYGNPDSQNHAGKRALEAVEEIRTEILETFSAKYSKVLFTGSATESITTIFRSLAVNHPTPGHIITLPTEHKAVLENCDYLAHKGWKITYLNVDHDGKISLAELENAIEEDTVLIAIMEVNNEIGLIHPISEINALARRHEVLLLVDGSQGVGRNPAPLPYHEISFYVISGHKIYGPKGISALVCSTEGEAQLHPLLIGGGQEEGLRSSTLNVPGIVGLGAAIKLAIKQREVNIKHATSLRQAFYQELNKAGVAYLENGCSRQRVAHNINVVLTGVNNKTLALKLFKEFSFSAGSACSGGHRSHVLKAIGLSGEAIRSSIRIGLGKFNTVAEVRHAAQRIATVCHQIKR